MCVSKRETGCGIDLEKYLKIGICTPYILTIQTCAHKQLTEKHHTFQQLILPDWISDAEVVAMQPPEPLPRRRHVCVGVRRVSVP